MNKSNTKQNQSITIIVRYLTLKLSPGKNIYTKYQTILSLLLILSLIVIITPQVHAGDDIELPDIIIVGEADRLPDTISLDRILRRHWTLNDISPFKYKPFITFHTIGDMEKRVADDFNGILCLDIGSKYFAGIRGAYSSSKNPLHNYSLSLNTLSLISDRSQLNSKFIWSPRISSLDNQRQDNDPFVALKIEHNSFTDERGLFPNKINYKAIGIYLSQEPVVNQFFEESSMSVIYNSFDQNYEIDNSLNDIDFSATTNINVFNRDKNQSYIHLDLSHIRRKFSTSIGFLKDELYYFDDSGIIVLADKKTVLPSLQLNFNHFFTRDFSVHWNNKPSIDKQRRIDLISDNPDQSISFDNEPTKTIINSNISLNFNFLAALTLSHNIRYHKDYYYYSQYGGDFELESTDLLENIIKFSLAYHLDAFIFNLNSEYVQTNEFIPFKPDWIHSLYVSWSYRNLRLSSEWDYKLNRQDINEEYLDDSLLINLYLQKKLPHDMSLNIALKNVLNSEYRKYQLDDSVVLNTGQIPQEKVRVQVGLSWRF